MGQMLHDSRQPLVETGLAKHGFPPYGCGASHTPHYAVRREGKHLLFKKPPLVSPGEPGHVGAAACRKEIYDQTIQAGAVERPVQAGGVGGPDTPDLVTL